MHCAVSSPLANHALRLILYVSVLVIYLDLHRYQSISLGAARSQGNTAACEIYRVYLLHRYQLGANLQVLLGEIDNCTI